jgi:cobalt-zinc-cadmium resistance protein CzcA
VIAANATKAYQNGDVSYMEYLQGLETALGIQTDYLQTIHDYNQAAINLQYLLNQ